ncbi:hypothetical protein NPA07_01790 [Mycoplasmopsis caviae]|uniref:Uncharacterized protein n=1 Tax=Mycoplasmopsis caviae TaxID=55603 RepID=A0A3P8KLM7_9BACT|nr:hypothetical protein [Mycoplasmopsis caviae]UUD35586.1 hypothetical protein NPA07_01790 [Mycoplasmopsis caviae]VDR41648.1 Uncharacterised protein [Mycoplasmopsis caviae]
MKNNSILEKVNKIVKENNFDRKTIIKLSILILVSILTFFAFLFLLNILAEVIYIANYRGLKLSKKWIFFLMPITCLKLLIYYLIFRLVAKVKIHQYSNSNIFKALKWYKIYCFITFKFKKINELDSKNSFDEDEVNIIKVFSNKGLIPLGSASFVMKYKNFWRKNNNIDFVSTDFSNISNDWIKDLSDIEILHTNSAAVRLIYKSKYKIEIMNSKVILPQYWKYKNGKKIINKYWLFGIKLQQLFRLLTSENLTSGISKKISDIEYDIAFLLANEKISMKKAIDVFKHSIISNSFFYNFVALSKFDIRDEIQCEKVKKYLDNFEYFNDKRILQVLFVVREMFKKLKIDEDAQKLYKAIDTIIYKEQANKKYVQYANLDIIKDDELILMFKKFGTKLETNSFSKNNLITESKQKQINNFLRWLLKTSPKSDNGFDIRYLILSEMDRIYYEG